MALLYLNDPLPVDLLDIWVRSESKREKEQALSVLDRLRILSVVSTTASQHARGYKVTDAFASSLRQALTGAMQDHSFGLESTAADDVPITVAGLDDYARRQWEGVLGYMVAKSGVDVQRDSLPLSRGVKQLLQACHLVEVHDRRVEITQQGFAFVLQDLNTQVWHILLLYVQNAEANEMDCVEVLALIFLLSSLKLGQAYEKTNLSSTQLRALDELSAFGIVYEHQPVHEATRFYPTRLATSLTSDTISFGSQADDSLTNIGPSVADDPGSGFIFVETNYRLYAYTSSPLQISLIALFTTLKCRFPNLVTGKITRQSIRRAIDRGITADQIISYLSTHAHPQMRRHQAEKTASRPGMLPSVLPPTVVDQIQLWQLERERVKATTGFLFKDFVSYVEYELPCRYAEEIGLLAWKSDQKRMFFVTRHEQIVAFLKARTVQQ